jgi:hypothetical protein
LRPAIVADGIRHAVRDRRDSLWSQGIFIFRPVMFVLGGAFAVGALLSLSQIPEARRVCQQSGGGICPFCGHKNEVKWNS